MNLCSELSPLTLGEPSLGQLAYDGNFYYMTTFCQNKIIKTTTDFNLLQEISTVRPYDCLCFDSNSCCFWATIPESARRIFQLDCNLREIACFCIPSPFHGKITSISFHPCHNGLLIAYPSGLVEYTLDDETCRILPQVKGLITCILSLCPGYFVVTRQGKQQKLHCFFDNGAKISESDLPHAISIRSMLYNPCHCDLPRIDCILSLHSCYPKFSTTPVTCYDLGFAPCICNHKVCQKCCKNHPNDQAVDDVLESIALVEAAISHILNAQGEQIQKVVAESENISELLEINGQINKTITKVTHLERVLCNKLDALGQISPSLTKKSPCQHLE